jgi:hypothetical protein
VLLSNDALRQYGIIPPKEPTPTSPSPPSSPKLHDILDDLTPEELKELGEDITDEDLQRSIDAHRRQREAQERLHQKRARFGRVYPIGRDDYTREVTEASKVDEDDDDEEKGTGVICFLYKDGSVPALLPPRQMFIQIQSQEFLGATERSNIYEI